MTTNAIPDFDTPNPDQNYLERLVMDIYMKAFKDLTTKYVVVRNIIPDDNRHIFCVSSVSAELDVTAMLEIFKKHNLSIECLKVMKTPEGQIRAEITTSIT